MVTAHRIMLVDRSLLSHNLFRLLISPFGEVEFIAKDEFTEALDTLSREPADLVILNANVLGSNVEGVLTSLCDDPHFASIRKIFLCCDNAHDRKWSELFAKTKTSIVVFRPFKVEELRNVILTQLQSGGH